MAQKTLFCDCNMIPVFVRIPFYLHVLTLVEDDCVGRLLLTRFVFIVGSYGFAHPGTVGPGNGRSDLTEVLP